MTGPRAAARIVAAVLGLVAASGISACGGASTTTDPRPADSSMAAPPPSQSMAAPPPSQAGSASPSTPAAAAEPDVATSGYISLDKYQRDPAAYAASNVVLFFRADWCSECRETDANLKASKGDFPKKLIVVNVDYDNNADLKKKYGVTIQHTFVSVAPDGEMLKKWTGTLTAQAIADKV